MVLLEIRNLKVYFPIFGGKVIQKKVGDIKAVDGIDLRINRGEILGLVGESGCGKTTLARAILSLVPKTSGKIFFENQDLDSIPRDKIMAFRRKIQAIFQDPFLSLNPRIRIIDIVGEGIDIHKLAENQEREEKIIRLMKLVGLDPKTRFRYPIEFSAGQRQRIAIARSLAVNPTLLICDEPVSSLDVSIQDQILKLLLSLRKNFGLSYLFITHDLAVVKEFCDKVSVMYLGRIVEQASNPELYQNPLHPYTKALLSAIPIPDPRRARARKKIEIPGEVPSAEYIPSGCRFHPRCSLADEDCRKIEPSLIDRGNQHFVACHKV